MKWSGDFESFRIMMKKKIQKKTKPQGKSTNSGEKEVSQKKVRHNLQLVKKKRLEFSTGYFLKKCTKKGTFFCKYYEGR